jgi:hypothetical protein
VNGGYGEIATRVLDELFDRITALDLKAYVIRELDRQLAGGDADKPEPLPMPAATNGVGLKLVLQAAGLTERRRVKLVAMVSHAAQDALREKLSASIASELLLRAPSRAKMQREFDEWSDVQRAHAAARNVVAALKARGARLSQGRRAS